MTILWIILIQVYLLVMIKVNWVLRFSTLKFPSDYVTTFQLNRQLRSCISLQELKDFVDRNDALIQQYGKTMVLQYFNEFPVGFTYQSMHSPLRVFDYVINMQGLTLYEEQLKYANICKMIEYATKDSRELQRRAHEQERKIQDRIKHQPFDLVDALNWILFQRAQISSELSQHALDIICSLPLERSQSMIAKMLNSFLKKIEDLQWRSLRKYRPIFQFICHKYELSIESPKLMVSNFEKLVNLKLHLLGYDRVPRAVDQIATRLESELGKLDMYYLQTAFKCFENLPTSYNRRLFGLLYRQILGRMKRELFQLNSLPLSRLTRQQLEALMTAYVGNGLYIRNCIYFINCEESQQFFTSQVFLKALTEEFLKPLRAQENLMVDYSSYMSVGRALLDYYQPEDPIRPKIVAQLRAVHQTVYSKRDSATHINVSSSICSWLNLYSLDLQFKLFENRRELTGGLEEQMRKFTFRKYNSNWKAKKHHQQVRQILRKHANSPFPQIRNILLTLLKSELAGATTFDSNYFPPFLYMLEDCEQSAAYQQVLSPLYSLLRGDDAFAFIEAYIRSSKKSARLTLTIMEKLWGINRSPVMMLKLTAGVPLVYFQNGLGGLMTDIAAILEDVAIFLKGEDLTQFSIGELTSIMGFCRKFVKSTRILSHKLLILSIGNITQKLQEELKSRNEEMQIEVLMELLALTLELNYFDKQNCIAHINQLLYKIEEVNISRPLILLHLLQAKLMLKSSMPVDNAATSKALKSIVERVKSEKKLEQRPKVAVVLLKLHAFEQLQLKSEDLRQICQIVKDSLQKEEIYPSDIPALLGNSFVQQCDAINYQRLLELKDIMLFSLDEIRMQENPEFYIYCLRLAHKVRAPDVIERCLDHLTLLPLEPPFVIALVNILKYYTGIFRPQIIERLLKDTSSHFPTFLHHHIDVIYYINTTCYDPPIEHSNTYAKLLKEAEKDLAAGAKEMLTEKNPDSEQLFQLLVRTYKYYWVVIKNKQVNDTTLAIFKLNIQFIKNIFEVLNFRSFDGISEDLIFMIHLALFPKASALTQTVQTKTRSTFFSKNEPENNQYKEYHEYMRKLQAIIKTQAVRSFEIEEQLRKLKIYYKKLKETFDNSYTFGERYKGIQLHYYIRNGQNDYYLFVMTPKMRNNAGSFKGRVKLLQQLYTIILKSQPVIFDQNEPITIQFS